MKTNIKYTSRIAAFLAIAFVMSMCSTQTQENVEEQRDEAMTAWKQEKAEMKEQIQTQIDAIDDGVNQMNSRMESASEDLQSSWEATREDLMVTKTELQEKLDKVDDQSEESWTEFKQEVNDGIASVKEDLDNFKNEMTGDDS
jgi:uncharacterized protein YPO0396